MILMPSGESLSPAQGDLFERIGRLRDERVPAPPAIDEETALAVLYGRAREWLSNSESLGSLLLILVSVGRYDLAALAVRTYFDCDEEIEVFEAGERCDHAVVRLDFASESLVRVGLDPAVRERARCADLDWLVDVMPSGLRFMRSACFRRGEIVLDREGRAGRLGLAVIFDDSLPLVRVSRI